jgi:hypothetical protein
VSTADTPSADASCWVTGVRLAYDRPRSPERTCPSQRRNCSGSGRSSPSSAATRAATTGSGSASRDPAAQHGTDGVDAGEPRQQEDQRGRSEDDRGQRQQPAEQKHHPVTTSCGVISRLDGGSIV